MAIKLSDVSNALQKVIMPYIQDNFPKQTILLDQVKRNKGVTFMNNNFYAPIRSGRHGGVSALADDDNQLTTSKASIGQASVRVRILTGTFDISKLAIDATKTAKGAVENQLTWQASTLASDFARSVNRQYFMDGSGVVAKVASSAAATKVTVALCDSSTDHLVPEVHNRYGTINGDIDPLKYIHADMHLGVGTAGAAHGTVSAVESDGSGGGTITFTGTTASVAHDALGIIDADGGGFGTAEILGLGRALADGTSTYAGTTRGTYGWTAGFGSVAEALTLSKMEDKYLGAREYGQMGDRYAIFVNKTLFKKYGDILTSMRRAVNQTELLGGWTGLEFAAGGGRVGVFLDYDTPDGECLIVNLDSLTICQVSDLDWMESPKEGALVRKTGYITYQATMVWFTNLLCLCPAASAKLAQKTD